MSRNTANLLPLGLYLVVQRSDTGLPPELPEATLLIDQWRTAWAQHSHPGSPSTAIAEAKSDEPGFQYTDCPVHGFRIASYRKRAIISADMLTAKPGSIPWTMDHIVATGVEMRHGLLECLAELDLGDPNVNTGRARVDSHVTLRFHIVIRARSAGALRRLMWRWRTVGPSLSATYSQICGIVSSGRTSWRASIRRLRLDRSASGRLSWLDPTSTTFGVRVYDSETGSTGYIRVSRHLTVAINVSDTLLRDLVNYVYEDFCSSDEPVCADDVFKLFERLERFSLPLELELSIQRLLLFFAIVSTVAAIGASFLVLLFRDSPPTSWQDFFGRSWSGEGLVVLVIMLVSVGVVVVGWKVARPVIRKFFI
jgi:hypothetical protein